MRILFMTASAYHCMVSRGLLAWQCRLSPAGVIALGTLLPNRRGSANLMSPSHIFCDRDRQDCLTYPTMEGALSRKSGWRRSIGRRQADFGEQLLEGGIAVKAGETLVNAKVQHDSVMRQDADRQVLERVAAVAKKSFGLRHEIRGQQSLFIQLPLLQKLGFEQAAFPTLGEALRCRLRHR